MTKKLLAVLPGLLILAFVLPADAGAQSILVPVTTSRGMVFDYSGQYLYLATSNGLVDPYNLSSGIIEMPFNLGGFLNGIDSARDNSFLLIAQGTVGTTQGTFHKLALGSGTVTNINYTRASGETGAWDVAISSNGLALVTTQFGGSGWTPLRQIDLATNAISTRTDSTGSGSGGTVRQNTQIHHSADGSRLYFLESNVSSGPIFTYSATSNAFGPSAKTMTFGEFASAAVNRDGSLLGTRVSNQPASLDTAPNLGFVHSFPGLDSGVAFDGVRDLFYGVNSGTDEIVVYNTNTFVEKFRLSIGEDVSAGSSIFGPGTLIASPDGDHLALRTASGVRVFTIPTLVNVVSRQTHLSAGIFDLNLPLSGAPAVENRSGGGGSSHRLIFTFIDPLLSVGNVAITGCPHVVQGTIGTDPSQYVLDLTNVCNGQSISVTLQNVVTTMGPVGDFSASVGVLLGDTNGDGSVNSAEISQAKSQSGLPVSTANFREDLNVDGTINSADISLVNSASGTSLPPGSGNQHRK
jgi:hypothetical protein